MQFIGSGEVGILTDRNLLLRECWFTSQQRVRCLLFPSVPFLTWTALAVPNAVMTRVLKSGEAHSITVWHQNYRAHHT
ncbi:hypothetical protein GN956_G134 [Arapaima gigas]